MIVLVDYGLGNINAFANVFKRVDVAVKTAKNVSELQGASKIILPGVGAFDHAMEKLHASGMKETLDEFVLEKKMPIIGICVGMQMLANSSDEGNLPGLSWIDATVKKFDEKIITQKTKLPHMGWNDVHPIAERSSLFNGLDHSLFYFLHSYYFQCNNEEDIIATASYGIEFTCAVKHANIYGVQFHPEKSHHYGEQLLHNFAKL
ncbi:imidazole glycerol phosphate synthase subunit HisH [Pedobacter helvus]|uniref:Imidazole glycerol phosphate synthase subunit HisH n=1 Tax=Pedobacter helvus TaxID=2563444 RepID=A0ABW9JFU2_9SPHI|nr:imidazole glycerol phosphate synthase subunit HisH [Pedobacter ureilyticus]